MVSKHENTAYKKRGVGGGGGGGGGRELGSAVLWLLAFPGEGSRNFQCISLGQERFPHLLYSNVLLTRIVEGRTLLSLCA